jgi:SAM-dependent methyltransferase
MSDPFVGDGLLPPHAYARDDESPDDRFYSSPRKVVHIDDSAIAAVGRLYAELLPSGGRVLDLMSSWRSHLPAGYRASKVVGLGLNAEEMADNPQLTSHVVHDVNVTPTLPFEDDAFDAAICAVSIQYVTHPILLFRDVARVLRVGAPYVVTFSNRCFPTKAVSVWLDTTDDQHVALVHRYFEIAGGFTDLTMGDRSAGGDANPLYAVWARKAKNPT